MRLTLCLWRQIDKYAPVSNIMVFFFKPFRQNLPIAFKSEFNFMDICSERAVRFYTNSPVSYQIYFFPRNLAALCTMAGIYRDYKDNCGTDSKHFQNFQESFEVCNFHTDKSFPVFLKISREDHQLVEDFFTILLLLNIQTLENGIIRIFWKTYLAPAK